MKKAASHYLFNHGREYEEIPSTQISVPEGVNPSSPILKTPDSSSNCYKFFTQCDNEPFTKDADEVDFYNFELKIEKEIENFSNFLKTGGN